MSDKIVKIDEVNLRVRRAQSFASALMHELDDVLGDVNRNAVYERLLDVLHRNGTAWTNEEKRVKLDLTPSERETVRRQRELLATAMLFPRA